jgi:hypothetical protein
MYAIYRKYVVSVYDNTNVLLLVGDCWFLAAVAGLTCNSERFAKVVPADNVWTRETYSGICHFM